MPRHPSRLQRCIAGVLAWLLAVPPLAVPAYGAPTALADEPLSIRNGAKPNIVLTVDDSSSMLFDFLPDQVIDAYCRDGTGKMAALCGEAGGSNDFSASGYGSFRSPGYIAQQWKYPYTTYGASYDASGPGAGCDLGVFPPRCSGGIDPTAGGASPNGIERYPRATPFGGKLYEYWQLWPAPVHNGAFNKLYYNPALTYEPPVNHDGTSYPQMSAANTSTWTRVPADPWASPVTYVDLTLPVTVGQWCNSDWTQGVNPATGTPFVTDPSFCRANGQVAAASDGAPAATGDYRYPWMPPGVTASNPPNVALSLAWSKLARGGELPAAQDPKYFYQNDNVIWCDTSSALWPRGGTALPQTCNGLQYQSQSCSLNGQTCNGAVPQVCNNAQSQTCNGSSPQTCSGASAQTCTNYAAQTCTDLQPSSSGCVTAYEPPRCNLCVGSECPPCTLRTTCPLVGKCSVTGATCGNDTDCSSVGQCSLSGAACTSDAACPARSGTCNVDGASCTTAADCPTVGFCSITNNTCSSVASCAIQPGTCSADGRSCTGNANCPTVPGRCSVSNAVCSSAYDCGACSITGAACNSNDQCPRQLVTTGTCSITGAACTSGNPLAAGGCRDVGAAAATATCSDLTSDGARSLLADAAGPGLVCRRNNQSYGDVAAGRYNYPDARFNFPVTGGVGKMRVWIDDDLPSRSETREDGGDRWNWITDNPAPYSGSRAHQSVIAPGEHQHYLYGGAFPVNGGDILFSYVYLDPANPPTQVMLQWHTDDGWEHRAYWGGNGITFGVDGTDSRRYMGPLPALGQWVRLTVPAALVGLEGRTVDGIAFTLYDGRATWDYTGVAESSLNGVGSADACAPTPRFSTVPRHYWKTSVEWCDKAIATAGDPWLGYGSAAGGGSCQAYKDATHIHPRFYAFGADPGVDNVSSPAFQRVDLDIGRRNSNSYTHTWKDESGTVQTVVRTFDEEMQNYANWFAYYRTRIQAVKTVASLAFKELDNRYRVGFHTLSNEPRSSFVDVADFSPSQKKAWFDQLFAIAIRPNQETPNLDAIVRIGEYYKNGGSAALERSSDPIVLSCQKNWHMLFTDGLTNQKALPSVTVGNQDRTIPTLPEQVLGLPPGTVWPAPYREDPSGNSADSAADYIMHYWVTDLRTAGAVAPNNVPVSDRDPASWQHVNFAAMSLGTEGKLPAGNQSLTENALRTGSANWPQPYPNVYRPDESGVDDLWHAAINGRGRFVNAQSAAELKLGMGQILQDITNQAGSRAGVAFENVNLSSSNRYIYRVRFEPGWAGGLTKVEIDPATGEEVREVWRAADQLASQLLVVPGTTPTPWFTGRRIVTLDAAGNRIPFLWNSLAASQQDSLAPGRASLGQSVLEYLRGNGTREGTRLGQFRVRAGPLGDIVNSQAVYVGPPRAPYLDTTDPGYAAFKAAQAGRAGRIYVGANDGMLHAFDDGTGQEVWAYVPLGIYRGDDTGLGALTYQDGALPGFQHHYYVDGTPRVVDVDFGGGDWRSVLVGGLGKGGRSYFAIDVTSPSTIATEADAAQRILWEFTDPDMGYSYGKPVIAKTRAFGGRWLAIIASGYNNPSGVGKIFFVDIATGQRLHTLTTGAGTAGNPSGLAHIAGYTQDYRNQLAEQIYGGDLLGNLWRFDVSSSDPAQWAVDKIASLTDAGGTPQPVTTPPQIEVDVQNGVDRWVFVGTGKLYHESDLASTQTQTLYALRDGDKAKPTPSPVAKVLTRADLGAVKNENGLDKPNALGWFDDLPAGQRIVVPPQAALSVVAYVGTSIQDDPCLPGQPATIYARNYSRGASVVTNEAGKTVESVYSPEGGVGLEILGLETAAGGQPNLALGVTLGTTGKLRPFRIRQPEVSFAHRMSWRLLSE